jgi:hypothetical protein
MPECIANGFAVHTLFDGRSHPRVPVGEQLSNMACWPPWQKRVRRYRRSIRRPTYNPTHLQWKQVLAAGVPMLKVDLLRDNPVGIDARRIHDWLSRPHRVPTGNHPRPSRSDDHRCRLVRLPLGAWGDWRVPWTRQRLPDRHKVSCQSRDFPIPTGKRGRCTAEFRTTLPQPVVLKGLCL